MCGLIACLRGIDPRVALPLIRHRGVRSSTAECEWGAISHARLPIVGTGSEHDQPVDAPGWTIAFVGELLDFRDEDPEAECDLKVVVRTWCEEGAEGFRKHDGFWSIAAISHQDGALHLLTDYLAQKPIYYRVDLRSAASEPEALASLGPTSPDEVYLSSAIKWGYCPDTRRTPYREVKRVLPGEYVIIDQHGFISRNVIDPIEPVTSMPAELKEEIEQAVRRRVQSSDVPVAALISGGLDSSIVYTLAKRYGTVVPYYASDPSETPDMHERFAVTALAGRDNVREIYWNSVAMRKGLTYMQEPIDLGSLLPQVALSEAIEESVCLTGDGADEMFGGYGRSTRYDSQASDVWQELVAWHLPRLDRVMMRNRIEVRSPFLARRVAAAALGLPRAQRTNKSILRDLFRWDLPKGLADAPKRPLRTARVEVDREQNSRQLVELFREATWPS